MDALAVAALVLAAASMLFLVVLAVRRLLLGMRERRRFELEDDLRPLVLALLEGRMPRELTAREARVFAAILSRYAKTVRGDMRDHIAGFVEESGAVDDALRRLRDRRRWIRAEAAFALGDMGSARPVDALIGALDDPERDVRAAAARSLGRLGAVEAVEPLLGALDGRVPRAVVDAALIAIGPAAVTSLLRFIGHPRWEERADAVRLIGLIGNASHACAVQALLLDTSAEVRACAARALGRLGDEDAAAALREALADRVPFVRAAAAEAVGLVGDADALEALVLQARGDEFDAARAAAEAIGQIDPDRLRLEADGPAGSDHLQEAADLLAS